MNEILQYETNSQGQQLSRSDGKKKKLQILKATLQIIVREGIRGVKHRAVAKEAGVSLSSTTYYFKDIHDLISDTFMYFASEELENSKQLKKLSLDAFYDAGGEGRLKAPEELLPIISRFLHEHITQQVKQHDRRVLEYAFQNEALHNKKLAEIMISMQDVTLRMIKQICTVTGNANPDSDAHIILACIRHIEYQLVVDKNLSSNDQVINEIIKSLIKKLFINIK